MHGHRSLPSVAEMDEVFLSDGHLWIQEYMVGALLRFRMEGSGLLHFGDSSTVFAAEEIPIHLQPAAKEIRETLDRDRLRDGVDAVEAYTFFGVVPLGDGVEYDWDRTPAFLGHDIWDGTSDSFAPEDVTERVFNAVGLETVPVFEKELPATHFDPGSYSFPQSALMDAPVPGVVIRKKHGQPAVRRRPDWSGRSTVQTDDSAVPDLDEWMDTELTRETLSVLIDGPADSIWNRPVAELVERVAGEFARRKFGVVSVYVESHPEQYESAVRERIEALRRDEIG